MSRFAGIQLHHLAACRIIGRYLTKKGALGVVLSPEGTTDAGGLDITCTRNGRASAIKVKADPYYGNDPARIADRELPFYRREGVDYAFEAISHHVTRQPGWIFNSEADDLYYYFLALGESEAELAALLEEPDEVFFSELRVERDELHIVPMEPLREWFEANYERYTPRPVLVGDHSAWYRLVPRDVLRSAVPVSVPGPVFAFTTMV